MLPIDKLLAQLDKVRRNGRGRYSAVCPAHDDRSPSLAIKERDDGQVLIYCFAGCSSESIVSSLGLTLGDLFMPNDGFDREQHAREKKKQQAIAQAKDDALLLAIARSYYREHGCIPKGDEEKVADALKRVQAIGGQTYGC